MVGDAGHTMRNAGLLMAQRGFHVLGVTLFAVLVPRLMGPALFGRYALLISVSLWFALLNAPGAVSMLTRSIPRFVAANDGDGLRRLATSLVVLRALTGSFAAVGYFLVSTLVLGEPDRVAAAFVAAGVLCCTVGTLSFALFLGLNQAARWGLGDLLHRWLALAFVPIGFAAAGLRGACLGPPRLVYHLADAARASVLPRPCRPGGGPVARLRSAGAPARSVAGQRAPVDGGCGPLRRPAAEKPRHHHGRNRRTLGVAAQRPPH